MAAILKKEDEDTWLNPDVVEPEQLIPLLTPYPAQEMISYPVSKRVNSWRNDSEDLIQPLS
jgi:putative SOS response-associated peptidase YedK